MAAAFGRAGQQFDVVQIEVVNTHPGGDVGGILGFDICRHGHYSLLSWGLHWDSAPSLPPPPVGPLLRLTESFFRPLLNENGLFSQWSEARFFLDVVEAIAALSPGTWEAPGHEQFDIVRLTCIQSAKD